MNSKKFNSSMFFILTTLDDKRRALSLSEIILKKRLAACISCREVESSYWWKNKISSNKEFELLIKTNQASLSKVIDTIKDLHDYDIPEIIHWPVNSSQEYMSWLNESCN